MKEFKLRKVAPWAVLAGGVVDIVTTNVLAIPFLIVVMGVFGLTRRNGHSTQDIFSVIHAHPILYLTQISIGLIGSILGGYVAARIAKKEELLNGALSSVLCILFAVYSLAKGKGSISLPVHLLLLPVSPLAGALGGYLRLRKNRATQNA